MSTTSTEIITFIGAGNMAEALIRGMLAQDPFAPGQLRVTDIDPARRAYFENTYGIAAWADNAQAVAGAHAVVLAVKPQQMVSLLQGLASHWTDGQLVVSIAAGLPAARIEAELPATVRVVRVMPNTPALVGRGVHAIGPGTRATAEDTKRVATWLGASGQVVHVTEAQMDAVTAISGSGPAYVFYLMEAMQTAAASLGLEPEMARDLVIGTVAGAAALWEASPDQSAADLRARVTSKGGTTAAAMAVLDEAQVQQRWVEAMQAAYQRARDLAQQA